MNKVLKYKTKDGKTYNVRKTDRGAYFIKVGKNKRYLSIEQIKKTSKKYITKKLMYGGHYTKNNLDSFFKPGFTSNFNDTVSLNDSTISEDTSQHTYNRIYDMYVYDSEYRDKNGTLIPQNFYNPDFNNQRTTTQKDLIKFALHNRAYIRDGYTIDVDISKRKYFNLSFEFAEYTVDSHAWVGKPSQEYNGMTRTQDGTNVHYITSRTTGKHNYKIVFCRLDFKKVSYTTTNQTTQFNSSLYFTWSSDY